MRAPRCARFGKRARRRKTYAECSELTPLGAPAPRRRSGRREIAAERLQLSTIREAHMRTVFTTLALLALSTAPTLAQNDVEAQMNRAERELRDSMAPAGAEVQRTAPDEIRVRMPS